MNPQNIAAKTYSPFWALILVFATLIFLQAWYVLKDDINQRSQIEATQAQLKSLVGQAQTINQTTEAIGRELMALSSSSEEAARIITEFNIQLNQPAQPK